MNNLFGIGLALAATASLATADGPDGPASPTPLRGDAKVTFTPGKGITFDGGDAFSLTFVNRLQEKWRYVNIENAPDTNGFRTRRARQTFRGHVWNKDFTYKLQLEHAESVALKDAWMRYGFYNSDDAKIAIRLGQQKTRHGRESDGTSAGLEFVERSVASNTFSTAWSTGALFEGTLLEGDKLYWNAGAFNTDVAAMSSAAAEEGTNSGENELNFVFGLRFDPQGSIGDPEYLTQGDLEHNGNMQSSIGASLFIGNDGGPTTDVETTSVNINAMLKTGSGIAGMGEVWLRTDEVTNGAEADSTGWYVSGSYTTAPMDEQMQWGFALRAAMVDFDDAPVLLTGAAPIEGSSSTVLAATAGDVFELNGAVSAYYHKHALKTQFGYTFQAVSPTGGTDQDNHAIEVMVTAVF